MNETELQAMYDDAMLHTRAQNKLRDQFYDASTVRLKLAKLKNLAESAKSPTAAGLKSQWIAARLIEAKAKLVWLEARQVAVEKIREHTLAMPVAADSLHLFKDLQLHYDWKRENMDLPEIAKASVKLKELLKLDTKFT